MAATCEASGIAVSLMLRSALLITLALLWSGCAARGGHLKTVQADHALTGVEASLVSQRTPEVASPLPPRLRDPLAETAPSAFPSLGARRYERFVTARLDRLAEFWNRGRADSWNAWAKLHLRDGDLVFIQSKGNLILGVIDFSDLTQNVTESPFTHVGIVAVEGGDVVVYDTVVAGPTRREFGQMMALPDVVGVAVKRLQPAYERHVQGALTYCRRVHQRQIGFDKKLRLDNDKLYCTEMVELAFRSTGLPLSEPVRWNSLPGLQQHPVTVNALRLANGATPDEYVIIPGNEHIGMWASPKLELVLGLTAVELPPAASEALP